MISDGNKEKHVEVCEKMIAEDESFDNVIFTDESSVMLETHQKKCNRRKGEPRKLKPRPKHPVKVHVWGGGISKCGATGVAIFTGIMTATRYTQILDASLLPFTREVFPDGYRFQQDNDPKHCARYTRAYFNENNADWWRTPAESPDLNPIENVWGSMKEYLRNVYKPRGLDDPKQGIRQFWQTLTPSVCTRYISITCIQSYQLSLKNVVAPVALNYMSNMCTCLIRSFVFCCTHVQCNVPMYTV